MEVKLKVENVNNWSDVNRPESNIRIYHLQVRIYKASQNGDGDGDGDGDEDKAYKFSKLLIACNYILRGTKIDSRV
jgi:hypothetical protein